MQRRPTYIHPVVWDAIQRAGPQNCYYFSSLGPVDAPGVGEPLDRAANLITGSEITAEQQILNQQPVQGAGGGLECLGDDHLDAPALDFAVPTFFAVVARADDISRYRAVLSYQNPDERGWDLTSTTSGEWFAEHRATGETKSLFATGSDSTRLSCAVAYFDPPSQTFRLLTRGPGGVASVSDTITLEPSNTGAGVTVGDRLSLNNPFIGAVRSVMWGQLSLSEADLAPLRDALYYSHVPQ